MPKITQMKTCETRIEVKLLNTELNSVTGPSLFLKHIFSPALRITLSTLVFLSKRTMDSAFLLGGVWFDLCHWKCFYTNLFTY